MATAKSLQTPKIIELENAIIRIAHPDISRNINTNLAAPFTAGATSVSFYDNNGFSDDDWFIVGQMGKSWTEECDVNGAVTRGQSITITNSTKFNHEPDAPVTKIYERGIRIYGANSIGGASTLIASIDSITTPIADAIMIQWDKPYTEFVLKSTDTNYNYYYAVFTDGTTNSASSVYVPYTGVPYNKIEPVIQEALDMANAKIVPGKLTREMFVDWANDFQDSVTQFTYQDPRTGRFLQKDWSFEVIRDDSSLVLSQGKDEYSLSLMNYPLKYPNSDKSIIDIQIGTDPPLKKIAIKDMDFWQQGRAKTHVTAAAVAGDTYLDLWETADLESSGTVTIGAQTITYTSKTSSSILGIPVSGDGAITSAISDGDIVWQGVSYGTPRHWAIFNGKLYLDVPPSATYDGKLFKIRYFKALSRITSVADGTEIPFTNVLSTYFTGRIFYRLGQTDLGMKWDKDYEKDVLANAQSDDIPQMDEQIYYHFDQPMQESSYYINF